MELEEENLKKKIDYKKLLSKSFLNLRKES